MPRKRTITLSDKEVSYDIIRSARRTVSMAVKHGGEIIIRAPRYVPEPVIVDFIISKERWILRQQERLREADESVPLQTYHEGDSIPFLGGQMTLTLNAGRRLTATADGQLLRVTCPDNSDAALVKAIVDGWYLAEAKKRLIPRTFELAAMNSHVLASPTQVGVRRMKSRWGTCRTNGKIMLNSQLMKKRQELIDSVILHELCHLRHHNHGSEFYALLESLMPGYKKLRKELRYI